MHPRGPGLQPPFFSRPPPALRPLELPLPPPASTRPRLHLKHQRSSPYHRLHKPDLSPSLTHNLPHPWNQRQTSKMYGGSEPWNLRENRDTKEVQLQDYVHSCDSRELISKSQYPRTPPTEWKSYVQRRLQYGTSGHGPGMSV